MIISIYCTHSSGATNRSQLRSLSRFIETECSGKGIIIGGDFNAHLHLFAKCNNTRGRLLLEFCDKHELVILSSTELCQGRHTRKEATIDYMLCNDEVMRTCQSMEVDERREVKHFLPCSDKREETGKKRV